MTNVVSIAELDKQDPLQNCDRKAFFRYLAQVDSYEDEHVHHESLADFTGVRVQVYLCGLLVAEYMDPHDPSRDRSYRTREPVVIENETAYRILANGTDFGTYWGRSKIDALRSYVQNAEYDDLGDFVAEYGEPTVREATKDEIANPNV